MKRAACLIFAKDDLFLAVSRKNDFSDFGLPGGKVDPGETDEEACVREIFEETGLRISGLKKVFEGQFGDYWENYFVADVVEGDIVQRPGEGIVAWVTAERLGQGSFGHQTSLAIKAYREKV